MSAATSGGLKPFRSPPIAGVMEWARTVVGWIVRAALMKYRTKMATSWTGAIRRHGECRRRSSWSRRIPDRVEDRRRCRRPFRATPILPCRALSARPGLSGASDRGRAFPFDSHWRGIRSGECDGSRRALFQQPARPSASTSRSLQSCAISTRSPKANRRSVSLSARCATTPVACRLA